MGKGREITQKKIETQRTSSDLNKIQRNLFAHQYRSFGSNNLGQGDNGGSSDNGRMARNDSVRTGIGQDNSSTEQYSWKTSKDGMVPEKRNFSTRNSSELQQEIATGDVVLNKYITNIEANTGKFSKLAQEVDDLIKDYSEFKGTNTNAKSLLEEQMEKQLQQAKENINNEIDKLYNDSSIRTEHYEILRSEISQLSNKYLQDNFLRKVDSQDSSWQEHDKNLMKHLESLINKIDGAIGIETSEVAYSEISSENSFAEQYSWLASKNGIAPGERAFSPRDVSALQQEITQGEQLLKKYGTTLREAFPKRVKDIDDLVKRYPEFKEMNTNVESLLKEHMQNLKNANEDINNTLHALSIDSRVKAEHYRILRSEINQLRDEPLKHPLLEYVRLQGSRWQQYDENLLAHLESQRRKIDKAIGETWKALDQVAEVPKDSNTTTHVERQKRPRMIIE